MTDVEQLILERLKEIRESQLKTETVLTEHIAKDSEEFGKINVTLATAKGRITGFVSAVSIVGGGLGAGASLLFKRWMGW